MSLASAVLRRAEPLLVPGAAAVLPRRAERARSLDEIVELVYDFRFGGISIAPWQVKSELRSFLALAAAIRPRAVLEIGTAAGGTLFGLSKVAADDAVLISVDLPEGPFGGGYSHSRQRLYRAFGAAGQRIELIRGDSHAAESVQAVCAALGERPVDVLFIDGDHTYEGVKMDFETYSPLVRPSGLIGLHDIAAAPRTSADADGITYCAGDVPRFWSELRNRFETTELVEDWNQGFGIGIIQWHGKEGSAHG